MGSSARSASPPTRRVIDVIEALTRHPGEKLGLSELARVCGISKPTCLAILTELSDAGYLRLDAGTKTYGLGPSLVTAGQAAQRAFALPPAVAERMQELSDTFGSMVVAAAHDGDDFLVVEVTTPAGMLALTSVGQSFPIVLPTASLFGIGQSDSLESEELRLLADEYRSAGYVVENLSPTLERVYRIIGENSRALAPEVLELIGDLLATMREQRLLLQSALRSDPSAVHRVGAISALCFDGAGAPSLMLSLYAHDDLASSDIAERGRRVRDAADAVTSLLDGRRPNL
ncbi:helix-turn-helix domain-containing protein [Gordonia malaquae]|uniref:helix-turn-helix domain-containing protein n=1 Tax=Gordonia malaquae TaxID=410332 RepID=UPI0030FE40BD